MTFMHDFVNEKIPVSFKDVYKMNCNIRGIYETRQAHLLHIPRTKSRFVDRLPLYQFPEIWYNWHKKLNVYTSRSGLRRTINYSHKSLSDYASVVKCHNSQCSDCPIVS